VPVTTTKTARDQYEAADRALYEAAFRTEDFAGARALLEAAHATAIDEGDRATEAAVLYDLGMQLHYQCIGKLVRDLDVPDADVREEEELFNLALVLRRELGDPAGTAKPLFGLGLVHQVLRRDCTAAMPYFWQALDLAEAVEESGDLYACSEFHRHVGFYYLAENVQPQQGIRHLRRSLEYRERLDDLKLLPSALVALGEAYLAAGDPAAAVQALRRAVPLAREAGLTPWRVEDAEQTLRQAEGRLQSA
jgi:tetratricopeptide (TPR) repeat protein